MQDAAGAVAAAVRVLGEQRHPREGLAAARTRIFFDVGVGLQVGPQVRAVGEGPVAVGTRERFFAGVGADVALQQPGPRERLAAHRALAGQRVGANVHLEGAQRHVHLLAVLARERFSGAFAGGAVKLAVLRQPGKGRVAFAAVRALVADALAAFFGVVGGRGWRRGRRRVRT